MISCNAYGENNERVNHVVSGKEKASHVAIILGLETNVASVSHKRTIAHGSNVNHVIVVGLDFIHDKMRSS